MICYFLLFCMIAILLLPILYLFIIVIIGMIHFLFNLRVVPNLAQVPTFQLALNWRRRVR